MRTNTPSARHFRDVLRTHKGAPARRLTPEQQLRRSVLTCMLFEDGFYEDGEAVVHRVQRLVPQVQPATVAALAVQARSEYKLRHVPLLLARELLRHPQAKGRMKGDTIFEVIQRADELCEFVALYWKTNDAKKSLPKQAKLGLARAFNKFDAYQLAKYDRKDAVRLRDVLFLCHAKPRDAHRAAIWRQLVNGTLPAPDTWEVQLSAGADKKETFERLLKANKLGYMALLRNLRNMELVNVDASLVSDALRRGAFDSKALPFRFLAAAEAAPRYEPVLDECMMAALAGLPRLHGPTTVLVDVSRSMAWGTAGRSRITYTQAGAALAALVRGVCDDVRVFTFSDEVIEVPTRHGMALIEAIIFSQFHNSTQLGRAVAEVDDPNRRLIVFTDEQSSDAIPNPKGLGYMVNVASNANGVGYGQWIHVDGFSEAVVRWIQEVEKEEVRCTEQNETQYGL